MKQLRPVDAVIVGGGWTGLLMAKEIGSRTPLSVLVLERGPSRTIADYQQGMDELDTLIRQRLVQNPATETVTLRHTIADRALPIRSIGPFGPATGVGGSGEHWGGVSYRYLPDIFRVYSQTVERYGKKRLPEDHAIRDWPVTYDDLEPFYTRVERMMGTSGKAGNIRGQRMNGGNYFEGFRSQEYPTPPMKMPYAGMLFRDAAQSLGLHPYPTPAATISQSYRNPDGVTRGPCVYCGYCSEFGCMVGSKAQPTNTLMPVINRLKNVMLKTSAWVRRIQTRDGRAVGVQYVDGKGEEFFQPAQLVILASFTLNNSRLLLLSQVGEPYDPKTGMGTVGSNFTHQVNASTRIFFDKPINRFMGAGPAGMTISDFDGDVLDHSKLSFLRGGIMRINCTGSRPIANFGVLPDRIKPRWGSEWKRESIRYFDRMSQFSFDGEHLAYKGNYLDLDPVYTDKYGDPLLRVTIDWRDNERKMAEYVTQRAIEIGRAMGATDIKPFPGHKRYDATRYQGTHLQGGTIMGSSPQDSVVNSYGQLWIMPNLFIVGASVYPQSAGPNPTLTVLALAYRTADAIIDHYLKHPRMLS